MKNNKLITLLRDFSRKEMTRFVEFVHSPYYNKHGEVRQLIAYFGRFIRNLMRKPAIENGSLNKYTGIKATIKNSLPPLYLCLPTAGTISRCVSTRTAIIQHTTFIIIRLSANGTKPILSQNASSTRAFAK